MLELYILTFGKGESICSLLYEELRLHVTYHRPSEPTWVSTNYQLSINMEFEKDSLVQKCEIWT